MRTAEQLRAMTREQLVAYTLQLQDKLERKGETTTRQAHELKELRAEIELTKGATL
jgi:hypothetical protein